MPLGLVASRSTFRKSVIGSHNSLIYLEVCFFPTPKQKGKPRRGGRKTVSWDLGRMWATSSLLLNWCFATSCPSVEDMGWVSQVLHGNLRCKSVDERFSRIQFLLFGWRLRNIRMVGWHKEAPWPQEWSRTANLLLAVNGWGLLWNSIQESTKN